MRSVRLIGREETGGGVGLLGSVVVFEEVPGEAWDDGSLGRNVACDEDEDAGVFECEVSEE
jgi:hypothetical protein